MDTNKIINNTTTILKDVSTIILGTKKDGTPRSIVDAKVKLEKQKRKNAKHKHL